MPLRPRFSFPKWEAAFRPVLERLRASVERMVFSGSMAGAATKALGVLNRGISRAKMPRVRTLLREPGLGLKLSRPVQGAFISRALSLDQIFGGLPLKETSGFKADSASVRMSSDVLDHGTPCGGDRGWSPHTPSTQLFEPGCCRTPPPSSRRQRRALARAHARIRRERVNAGRLISNNLQGRSSSCM